MCLEACRGLGYCSEMEHALHSAKFSWVLSPDQLIKENFDLMCNLWALDLIRIHTQKESIKKKKRTTVLSGFPLKILLNFQSTHMQVKFWNTDWSSNRCLQFNIISISLSEFPVEWPKANISNNRIKWQLIREIREKDFDEDSERKSSAGLSP